MKILVAGATGTVGRHIVAHLHQVGHQVCALTRNPAKAKFPSGVEVVAGHLTRPATFAHALQGVTGLHLINFDGGSDYALLQTGQEIVDLATKAGVRRVTVLRGGEKGSVEEAVEASDLDWTFLQPVEFMANALEWVEPICNEGVVSEPYANRRTALVHEADIAAVAATALIEDGHGGKTYTITGPEVLTPPKMVQIIGQAIGRELKFVELTESEARERWRARGFSDEIIEFFIWVHGNTPEIGYTVVPTVEEVTGKPPRTFAQWAAEHAAVFRR